MLIKKEILTLTALFCLFFLLFQTVGCKKEYYTPETIQGENESDISLPEDNTTSDSCADVTGLTFSSISYLGNPQYSKGYSVCQDECIDLDTDEGTWSAYDIYTGDNWCSDLNSNTENPTYIYCCAYCPQETHYCPISKSCVSDSSPEQGLQWELECPYITLSWDKDEKAVSYEIIAFYDQNNDEIEDGKCEEDISNTKERYFYYNLESSGCAAYYTGNVRFQIIPQYSDGLSIESYNTDWIDVSGCKLGLDNCLDIYGTIYVPNAVCSGYKPYFCYDGNLIKDCSKCGCPESWVCWENVPTSSVCNPKWLYNYNDFEIPSDKGFLELMENPYYIPYNLVKWMNSNFECEDNHETNFETYSPYEMYIKKKGICRDFATFSAYIEHYQGYDTYRLLVSWENSKSHMVSVHKEPDGYSYISNQEIYESGLSYFKEIAEKSSEDFGFGDIIKYYRVWNYDGLLVEKPIYKGKEYTEYEDFSKYEWV